MNIQPVEEKKYSNKKYSEVLQHWHELAIQLTQLEQVIAKPCILADQKVRLQFSHCNNCWLLMSLERAAVLVISSPTSDRMITTMLSYFEN